MSPERRGRPPKDVGKIIEKYQRDPLLWLKDTYGVELWDKQKEIFMSVWENRRTAVKSCYASGKSFLAGCLALAFVHLWVDSKTATTAPSKRQLQNIWDPIHQLHDRARAPIGSELLRHELRCGPGWWAVGFTTNMPERVQGMHAPKVLLIVDESAGIEAEIHERLDALMTGDYCHRLDIGNPHDPSGHFYELFHRDDVNTFTISAFDTPNIQAGQEVVPGLVTDIWVEEKRRQYGEDSPMWMSEVLGEFPPSSEDQLIPLQWVKAAQERWNETEIPQLEPVYAVDPAGGGMAEDVLCTRVGNYVFPIRAWSGLAGPELVGAMSQHIDPRYPVHIDSIGVGYNLVGIARMKDLYAIPVNVRETPKDPERFLNLRAELYWKLRDALDPDGDIQFALPDDQLLASQLTAIKYKFNAKGKIQIESKEEMASRGLPSPDRADALAMTFMRGMGERSEPISVGVQEELDSGLVNSLDMPSVPWSDYYH